MSSEPPRRKLSNEPLLDMRCLPKILIVDTLLKMTNLTLCRLRKTCSFLDQTVEEQRTRFAERAVEGLNLFMDLERDLYCNTVSVGLNYSGGRFYMKNDYDGRHFHHERVLNESLSGLPINKLNLTKKAPTISASVIAHDSVKEAFFENVKNIGEVSVWITPSIFRDTLWEIYRSSDDFSIQKLKCTLRDWWTDIMPFSQSDEHYPPVETIWSVRNEDRRDPRYQGLPMMATILKLRTKTAVILEEKWNKFMKIEIHFLSDPREILNHVLKCLRIDSLDERRSEVFWTASETQRVDILNDLITKSM